MATTVTPDDPNVLYSPYTWHVDTTRAKSLNSGAYFKALIASDTTADIATLTAFFDVTNMWADEPSRVAFRIDGDSWQTFDIAAELYLTIPVNGWTDHTVEFVFVANSLTAGNRWLAPQEPAVLFTGLATDRDVHTRPWRRAPLTGLIHGDSLTEGASTVYGRDGTERDVDHRDARLGYALRLGDLLGAEVGTVGFGGNNINRGSGSGPGNVPRFIDSIPYLWDGQDRDWTDLPDFIVANIGTNDRTDVDRTRLQTDVTDLVNYYLDHTPGPVVVVSGWDGWNNAIMAAGCAAVTDPDRVVYVDTTNWLDTNTDSGDGIHPLGYINMAELAPRIAGYVAAALAGGDGPGPGPSSSNYFINRNGAPVPILSVTTA